MILAILHPICSPAQACTIFVLTDANRALFCNNEDSSAGLTRIWFVPAGTGYYGAVYVGVNKGSAQGGLNSEGLAYDWVAGDEGKWEPDPNLPIPRGNSSARMLETCATVDDAIRFYRTHREASFGFAKILVADKTGASVIIGAGAKDGQLLVEKEQSCRGFGFGHAILDEALARHPESTAANGFKILRDCRQPGKAATKYSNIFDLKSGDIFLYPFPERDDLVKLNLTRELSRGAHYYDMPRINEQLAEAPRPLPIALQRFPVDARPIPDREPKVTTHIRGVLQDAAAGNWHADMLDDELRKRVSSEQQEIQADMKSMGELVDMALVQREEAQDQRVYLYRLEFEHAIVIERFVLDARDKLSAVEPEAIEWKPGAQPPKSPSPPLVGIGVKLRVEGENLVVDGIISGSPAANQKDLHAGDRILAIAQESGPAMPVETSKLDQTLARIRGPAGTTVRLTVVPAGEDASRAHVVSLIRAELKALPH
jgi:hypothetical protein